MNPSPGNPYPLQSFYRSIHSTYDLVNRLFTFGQDERWRRLAVKKAMESNPRQILDLCCGTGDLTIRFAALESPELVVTGYDFSEDMLRLALQKAIDRKVPSPVFIRGAAESMPFSDDGFDCITIGFGFRNLTFENPLKDRHINEIVRVLKPGGRLVILESSAPANRWIASFNRIYLKYMLTPLGGLISGDWTAYRYLAHSSMRFYTVAEVQDMFAPFGFSLLSRKSLMAGSVYLLEFLKPVT